MKSAIRRLRHNERRAAELRFLTLEALRAYIKMFIDGEREAPDDGLLALIAGSDDRENRISIHNEVWFPIEETVELPSKKLYASMREQVQDGVYAPDLEEEGLHVACIRALGMQDQGAEIMGEGEVVDRGTVVGITFVDGSEAMFVIDSDGYIKTAGSTHPVAEIELYRMEKPIWEPDDLRRDLSREQGEELISKLQEQDYVDAMINGLATATPREMDIFPASI